MSKDENHTHGVTECILTLLVMALIVLCILMWEINNQLNNRLLALERQQSPAASTESVQGGK